MSHLKRIDMTKAALAALFACVCSASAQNIDEELPLPRWEREAPRVNTSDPGNAFNSLLPGESLVPALPEEPGMLHFGPRLNDTPTALNSQITDLSLFLHGSLLQQSKPAVAPRVPTPVMALRDLSSEHIQALADSPANTYLIDTQSLLSEVAKGDLERLLAFHAGDARIRLYLLVLDSDQKLPDTVDPATIAYGALTRSPSCLAIYPLAEPWRARVLLSPSVHDIASREILMEMAADCIRDSQQADEPDEQLHRYAVRLSTRLFWLQKSMPEKAETRIELSKALKEIEPLRETATGGILWPLPFWSKVLLVGSAALLILWMALRHLVLRRTRSSQEGQVWMLSEPEVQPRLGGAFSAGSGALLSYKR
jgi:hypothetical protein